MIIPSIGRRVWTRIPKPGLLYLKLIYFEKKKPVQNTSQIVLFNGFLSQLQMRSPYIFRNYCIRHDHGQTTICYVCNIYVCANLGYDISRKYYVKNIVLIKYINKYRKLNDPFKLYINHLTQIPKSFIYSVKYLNKMSNIGNI